MADGGARQAFLLGSSSCCVLSEVEEGLGGLAQRIDELARTEERMLITGRHDRALAGARHRLPTLVLQLIHNVPLAVAERVPDAYRARVHYNLGY